MASAEVEEGAKLFFRKPENNTWGVLNTTETFVAEHPDIVKRVIAVYERARQDALKHPGSAQGGAGRGSEATGKRDRQATRAHRPHQADHRYSPEGNRCRGWKGITEGRSHTGRGGCREGGR